VVVAAAVPGARIDMNGGAVREKTAAEIFAELEALPGLFRWTVERYMERAPDPVMSIEVLTPIDMIETKAQEIARKEAQERAYLGTLRERVFWSISLTHNPNHGPGFYGRAPTLAGAWAQVVGQIAAYREIVD
jgi:hypothetical protein